MHHIYALRTSAAALTLMLLILGPAQANENADAEITLSMGGNGGVYFLAEPGELVVDVQKRDRNRRDG
jgi:uncharacterized protein YggE